MENTLFKLIFGALSAIVGIFAPIAGLVCCAITFVAVDFVTGIVASRHRAARLGTVWSFLENGAEVCNYPPFRWLRQFMQKQLSDTLGDQISQEL